MTGVLARIADRLRALVRRAAGRDPEPSAGIIDSQSVRESAEGVVPSATSGYDHYKNVNGRKPHLLAGTLGLLIGVVVSPASAQDRAGAAASSSAPAPAAGTAWPWSGPTRPTTATGPTEPPASSASPTRARVTPDLA